MDINGLKGRIAEALVEGILRRAGYQVAMAGRESQAQRLLKVGHDEYLPDFLVWKTIEQSDHAWPSYRVAGVEVKYRSNLAHYLQQRFSAEFSEVVTRWPELYFIFVTDNPEPGRSCFQAVAVPAATGQDPVTTVDLHALERLDIHRKTVEEYENLVRMIFPVLGSSREAPRRPSVRVGATSAPIQLAR
ncbi:MAG TPA: hypothetical protein VEL75_07160 [Candidatus Methylomirabilis sp.]|nr:hypothetical protein [Candidatus Methylomirabilis sp.]